MKIKSGNKMKPAQPEEMPVLSTRHETSVRLPAQLEAELLVALDEADREPGIAAGDFLEQLRRFE